LNFIEEKEYLPKIFVNGWLRNASTYHQKKSLTDAGSHQAQSKTNNAILLKHPPVRLECRKTHGFSAFHQG
jgi:hypothetical protein